MLDPTDIYFKNANPFVNRISPFASPGLLNDTRGQGAFVDSHFGYAWTIDIKANDAVYGISDKFISGPLDEYGGGQFSRLPYRRVPRIKVDSKKRLMEIVSGSVKRLNDITCMWRGQVQEYPLDRPESDRLKLYADAGVREPSLVPSGSRGAIQFEQYMESWFGLVDVFIDERLNVLARTYAPSVMERLRDETEAWRNSYRYKTWSFAAAQHYGLPSTGLDLTTDIEVALFFALHKFDFKEGGRVDIIRADAKRQPVIYLMGIHDNDLLIDEKLGPAWIQTKRARAQSAHFFGTAWGNASNRAAERIVAVLELHGHESWAISREIPKLFPPQSDDPFCAFLMSVPARFPAILHQVPINRVYHWA